MLRQQDGSEALSSGAVIPMGTEGGPATVSRKLSKAVDAYPLGMSLSLRTCVKIFFKNNWNVSSANRAGPVED